MCKYVYTEDADPSNLCEVRKAPDKEGMLYICLIDEGIMTSPGRTGYRRH